MSNHIVPIFIPHEGCPHDCVFCNQKRISGCVSAPNEDEVREMIFRHIGTNYGRNMEIAFYGGSFTGIPLKEQERYLRTASEFEQTEIKASTRPDCISDEVITLLKKYNVKMIELGVQSMSDSVLNLSGRGHSVKDVIQAVNRLKGADITVGIQTMTGLPGDSFEGALETAKRVIELKPEVVRIYPTLVIKGTALHDMYIAGTYVPMELEESVELASQLMDLYEDAGIKVIRVGLQATDSIAVQDNEGNSDVIAGPFHPAFRQLAESKRAYRIIKDFINSRVDYLEHPKMTLKRDCEEKVVYIKSKIFSVSDITGQKRINKENILKEFGYIMQIC